MSIPLVETAAAVTVTTVFPAQGTAAGGTTVAIMGSGFDSTTAVTFGGTAITSYIINSIFQITAITPAHAVGAVDVSVVGAGTGTLTNSYTYATVPDAPTIDTVTAGTASASVAFTAPASDGGSAITGYTVTSSPGGVTATGTASPITVTGLTNGTSYTFSVTATNGIGTSSASAASTAVTPVKGTPTVTLTGASSTSVTYGDSITFTAVVSGGASPSGTVTFMDGGTAFGSATISGGSASYSTSSLSYGAHTIYAVYGGDANNDTATSNGRTIYVVSPTIIVSPTTLPNPAVGSAYSQTIAASGGTAPYSYAVTYGALPTGLTLTSTGTLSGTPTAVGPYNFTVTATDANAFTSSRGYSVTAAMASPTVALSASSTSVTPGASVTFTATLSGAASPSGTITFKDGSTTLGSATVSGGSASYSTNLLALGARAITAVYGGDANNNGATSSVVSVTVAVPTIVLMPASVPTATAGTAYSQTFIASGGAAPYSYVATAGAVPTGLTLDSSSGTLSGTPTVAGPYSFTMTATDAGGYTGNRNYAITVASAAPSIVLAASPTSVAWGGSVTLTATLSGGASPTGTVTFKDGSTTLGTATLSGGSASYATSSLASGAHTITAVYGGDANNGTVTSSVASVSVAAPTIGLTPSSVPNATTGSAYSQTLTASAAPRPTLTPLPSVPCRPACRSRHRPGLFPAR